MSRVAATLPEAGPRTGDPWSRRDELDVRGIDAAVAQHPAQDGDEAALRCVHRDPLATQSRDAERAGCRHERHRTAGKPDPGDDVGSQPIAPGHDVVGGRVHHVEGSLHQSAHEFVRAARLDQLDVQAACGEIAALAGDVDREGGGAGEDRGAERLGRRSHAHGGQPGWR